MSDPVPTYMLSPTDLLPPQKNPLIAPEAEQPIQENFSICKTIPLLLVLFYGQTVLALEVFQVECHVISEFILTVIAGVLYFVIFGIVLILTHSYVGLAIYYHLLPTYRVIHPAGRRYLTLIQPLCIVMAVVSALMTAVFYDLSRKLPSVVLSFICLY